MVTKSALVSMLTTKYLAFAGCPPNLRAWVFPVTVHSTLSIWQYVIRRIYKRYDFMVYLMGGFDIAVVNSGSTRKATLSGTILIPPSLTRMVFCGAGTSSPTH